jgi:WD40 repeat protein
MFPRYALIILPTLIPLATHVMAATADSLTDALGDPLPSRAVARLGSSRLRHSGSINNLMFTPDGSLLASWGGEYMISDGLAIWEVATGKELRRVAQPKTWLDAWARLPDGRPITGFRRPPESALALSPDGQTAYLGSPEGTVHACDVASGSIRFSAAGHHDRVTDLEIVPGGRRLISTSWDGSALVWDVTSP